MVNNRFCWRCNKTRDFTEPVISGGIKNCRCLTCGLVFVFPHYDQEYRRIK
jgi:hypothetical protein